MPGPGRYLLSLLIVLSLLFIDLPRIVFAETPPVYSAFEEDITPPAVISTYPTNNQNNIQLDATISAAFTESMDADTINNETILVMKGSNIINGTVCYNDTDKIATFTLSNDLEDNYLDYGASYTVIIYHWSCRSGWKPPAGQLLLELYHQRIKRYVKHRITL